MYVCTCLRIHSPKCMPRTLAIQRTGRHFMIIEAFKSIRPSNLLQCASVIIFQGFKHCLHTFLNTQFLLSLDFIGFLWISSHDLIINNLNLYFVWINQIKLKKKLCEIEAEPASLFLFLITTEQILFSRGDV